MIEPVKRRPKPYRVMIKVSPAPTGFVITPRVEQFVIDLAERAGATFLQAFLSAVVATGIATPVGGLTNSRWFDGLMVGLLAAITAVLTTLVTWLSNMKPITNPYVDLLYRTVVTFGQTLLGYLVASGAVSALSFNWNAALLSSALAAMGALTKALIGLNSPHTQGASTLVRAT